MLLNRSSIFVFAIVLVTLFSNFSIATQIIPNTKHENEFVTLENNIREVLVKHDLVGFQLSLNSRNKTMWQMNFGLSSVSSNTKVNDATLFRIASISKTVTAVAVMQLIDRGVLRLDSPVHDLIPEIEIKNAWRDETPITVLHLLEHTAGFDDNHFKEYVVDGSTMSTKDALDYHPHTRIARYKPGQFMSYANVDPTLLAYIVEKLSGLRFEEYVKENIFTPLMMEHSDYFASEYVTDTLAQGYVAANNKVTEAEYEHIKDRASGAINSNVMEMSKFQQMLINNGHYQGKKILEPNSTKRMAITESTLAAKSGFKEGYGKFLIAQRALGARWLGHNGAMNGFLSAMWHNPARDIGYVFFTNTSGEKAYRADEEIHRLLRTFIIENYPNAAVEESPISAINQSSSSLYNPEILGEYRQNTSRLSLIGFIEGLDSFSSVFVEDDVVKLETSHSTYILLPVAQNIFTTQTTSGDEVNVIFIQNNGQWHYQIPSVYINAIKTNVVTKMAAYFLSIGFMAMALFVFVIWLSRLILMLCGQKLKEHRALGLLSIANIGLVSCLLFLGSAGSTGVPQTVLGQASIQSVGVTISLLVFCIFTLFSIVKFLQYKQLHLVNMGSKVLRLISIVAISTNILMLITLYYFDFLFVMLWRY